MKLKIGIVEVEASDWKRSVKFYRDTLGLDPLYLDEEHKWGQLKAGEVTIGLNGNRQAEYPSNPSRSPVTIIFEVEGIAEAIAALEGRGIEFHDKQLSGDEGYKIAYFSDPDGNRLAIFKYC